MDILVEMPEVLSCKVQNCAYNSDNRCHARAITVGGPSDHCCDTMFAADKHTERIQVAGVGACKVLGCAHNIDCECQARQVEVAMSDGSADCLTYRAIAS